MTRRELLDLAREKFLAAGDNSAACLGLAACALETMFFQTNRDAVATLQLAEQNCDRALALDPDSQEAGVWKAVLVSGRAERLSGHASADALVAAQRAMEGVRDSAFALNTRGHIAMISADRRIGGATYQAAQNAFDAALAAGPDYLPALINLARVLIRQARELSSVEARPVIENAIAVCDRVLMLRPEWYEALSRRAEARILRAEDPRLVTSNDWRNLAIADCTRALEIRDDWFPALLQRAAALRGNARNSYEPESTALRDKALADCRAALAIRSDFPPALVTAANILSEYGDDARLDEALDFANRAIEARDDSPHVYAVRGRIFLHRRDLDKAEADYSAADSRGRPAAYIKVALGRIALRRADQASDLEAPFHFLEAAKRAVEAIGIRADYPAAWLLHGKARFGTAQLEPLFANRAETLSEARTLFEKALDLDPILDVRIQLGRCLVELSSTAPPPESLEPTLHAKRIALLEAAQQQFLLATVQDPKSASAYDHLAGVQRRIARLSETRDFSAALRNYKTALELHPNYASALRGIGAISRDQGNLEESAAQLRAALEADPNNPLTIVDLAETLRRQDVPAHRTEAEAMIRCALDRGRQRAALLTVLGGILETCHHFEGAVQAFAEALALRQQAERAERLIRAALALYRRTKDSAVLRTHAEAVRAAIAIEPDNASAQKALADFDRALAA